MVRKLMPHELNLDQRGTKEEQKPADECLSITSIEGIFQSMVTPQGPTGTSKQPRVFVKL